MSDLKFDFDKETVQRFIVLLLSRFTLPLIIALFLLPLLLHAYEYEDLSCNDCHPGISLESSMHEDFECEDCHLEAEDLGAEHTEDFQTDYDEINETCGTCHEETYEEYLESVHGESLIKPGSDKEAAHCFSCHGSHSILPSDDRQSLVHPQNLAETCGICHAKPELVAKYKIPDLHPVELFSRSYHAQRLAENEDLMAATCNDCHGVHDIKISTDPNSSISHANIAQTCGKCHETIYKKYASSVHWDALARGQRESPACVDCHGEHEIILPSDPTSPVSKRSAAEKTCARCHTDEHLIRKYGLTEGKVSTYQDSYHGLAVLKGDEDAATCYECHNAHDILVSSDERSTVHVSNLTETCSKCHPGATDAFSQSYTHQSVILAEKPVEYYVKIIYIALIVVTIGGMLFHNAIIIVSHLVRKFSKEKSYDYIQRYTKSEVWQHLFLILSFFILVITGFALKFPEAFWVRFLTSLGLDESLRGLLHRIAAVILIVLTVWHLVEGLATKRGRQFFKAFLPGMKDVTGFIDLIKSSLSRSAERPRFDRFDYTEKMEYWALAWGTIVMVFTGFILWFPTYFGQYSPTWLIKVSETIHYYEAWLATLAIIVWHFFFVILHPDEYPMSMTWLNGRMSIEEYKHKHPLDLERIMREVEDYKQGEKSIDKLCFQAREYVRRHDVKP